MVEVFITKEFQARYQDLSEIIQKKAEKQERLFRQNPFYPSPHTEKLEPKGKQVWSFRIDKKYRIFFRFSNGGKKVIFFTVGPHDWIYKLKW